MLSPTFRSGLIGLFFQNIAFPFKKNIIFCKHAYCEILNIGAACWSLTPSEQVFFEFQQAESLGYWGYLSGSHQNERFAFIALNPLKQEYIWDRILFLPAAVNNASSFFVVFYAKVHLNLLLHLFDV